MPADKNDIVAETIRVNGTVQGVGFRPTVWQLARYYGIPYYSTAGISDAKTLDAQCGYETAISNLLVALAGGDFIHDAAGLMEFALTVSKEKLVIEKASIEVVASAGEDEAKTEG